MKPKIYISGKISGIENETPELFSKAESKPHKQCTCGQKYEECTNSTSDCPDFQHHKREVKKRGNAQKLQQ